jgi:hypothetical protein
MPNPMKAEFTKQMSAMVLPATGGEIGAWAEKIGVPHSQLMRELLDAGLQALRPIWTAQYGAPSAALLEQHVRRCTRQGGRQLERRRDYDENRRGAGRQVA